MARDALVAGVDAGGTHTVAVLVDGDGGERARIDGPGAALRQGAEDTSADLVIRMLDDAARQAGGTAIDALVVGAAGAGHAPTRAAFTAGLLSRGAPPRTHVVTDAEAAFASAFGDGPGVLLLAGTGSIALARDPAGAPHRAGGWGWRIGDEGSGFAMGRAGVAAVCQALDGRGPVTVLRDVLPAAAGVADPDSLIVWAREAAPAAVAALGAAVQDAARQGDPVASAIVQGAARDLLAHVLALQAHFPATAPTPVILAGGALRHGGALREAVGELAGRSARLEIVERSIDAARGAAWLARRLLSGAVS